MIIAAPVPFVPAAGIPDARFLNRCDRRATLSYPSRLCNLALEAQSPRTPSSPRPDEWPRVRHFKRKAKPMTLKTSPRFAHMLAPVLALAIAAPAAAQEARLAGNAYAVANATGEPLACRYRVNSSAAGEMGGSWRPLDPVAVGAEFSRRATAPGETISLDCSAPDAKAAAVTVRPGTRYEATRGADGKIVVARKR